MDLPSQYDIFITYKEDRLLLGIALFPVSGWYSHIKEWQ